jgi:TolB-like protein
MGQLFQELKRRNVIRVAIAYAVSAWLLIEVTATIFPILSLPQWSVTLVTVLLFIGFPIALIFAWAFELTPEGLKLEKHVVREESITPATGRKLDFVIIGMLGVAVAFFAYDKFVLDPSRDAVEIEAAVQSAQEQQASTIKGQDGAKSVAVLPFVALSNGPDDEYFADGLTEEILNSLAHLPKLLVTARTSSFVFKGQNVPIPEVAKKLGVAHVVEGSVRRSGNKTRITAQLIRANDGFHLWSDIYDHSSEDSFAVQADIAEKVAAALDVVLSEEQRARMRSTGLRNPEAFIAFQKGWVLLDQAHALPYAQRQNGLLEANKYFERTIELEPQFSTAHAAHADYYLHHIINVSLDGMPGGTIEEALRQAKIDLENASRYAASEGQRLSVTAEFALIAGQWRRMRDLITMAVSSPDCVGGRGWWAESQIVGSPRQSLRLWEKHRECDPLDRSTWQNIAIAQILLGDFQAAIETATRGMQSAPHRQIAEQLIIAYIATGQFDEAEAASHRLIRDQQGRQSYRHKMAAAQGNAERARELLDEMIDQFDETIDRFGIDSPRITNFAITGDRDSANQVAARLDARPLGILSLLTSTDYCYCGAPFDLEVTPNFARFVEEAGLPWPPPTPINWPLKDW